MKFSGYFNCPFQGLQPKVIPLSGIGFIEILPSGLWIQGFGLADKVRRRYLPRPLDGKGFTKAVQFTVPWPYLENITAATSDQSCVLIDIHRFPFSQVLSGFKHRRGQLRFYPDSDVTVFMQQLIRADEQTTVQENASAHTNLSVKPLKA